MYKYIIYCYAKIVNVSLRTQASEIRIIPINGENLEIMLGNEITVIY